jgi:tetratricopeptide (TPR) repeat protein
MGGVGKSQLAIEYAHQSAEDYDIVWWIPAEQPAATRAALVRLGEALGLRDRHDMRQAVTAVLGELEAGSRRWLLVYDNASNPDEIVDLIPSAGGRVLLTTRDGSWLGRGTRVSVRVFLRPESVEFLGRRGHEISPADADILAERLGDLPLALAQVASMQAATTMPPLEYLRLFDEHLDELLATGVAGGEDSFTTSARIAFKWLRAESLAAAQLLELLAFASPEPMSLDLLRTASGATVSAPLSRLLQQAGGVEKLARQVERYGLCRLSPNGPRLQVHRLHQLVVRLSLNDTATRRVRAEVHELLSAIDPGPPDDPRSWTSHAEIGSHLRASDAVHTNLPRMRDAVLNQIRYLYLVGDFEESRDLAEAALNAWRRPSSQGGLGDDHPQIYAATKHLANAVRALGDHVRSHQLIEETLTRAQKRLGDDDPETLTLAGSMGPLLRAAGRFTDALELDADRVPRVQRVYGVDSREANNAENNLAVNHRLLGDFRAARDIDHRVWERHRQAFGEDDRLTTVLRHNLAIDYYGLGRYPEALSLLEASLLRQRERLGSDHPDTLITSRLVAMTKRRMGDYQTALELIAATHQSCGDRFGPDHELTLVVASTYANTLLTAQQSATARSVANEALHRTRRVFGVQNPASLAAAVNFAMALRAVGEWRDAYEMDRVTRDELSRRLGDGHPFTLAAEVGLAADLAHRREYPEAAHRLERAHQAYVQGLGPDHPDTSACRWNLALAARGEDTGQADASSAEMAGALAELRAMLGGDHPYVLLAASGHRLECEIEMPPF